MTGFQVWLQRLVDGSEFTLRHSSQLVVQIVVRIVAIQLG